MSLVSLVRIKETDAHSIERAIERSADLIQFYFNKNIRKIAIKPNLCYYYDYSTGKTTDPRFVGATIDFLRERISTNAEIFIVESDASAMRCRYVFKMLGYEKMAKEKDAVLVNLSKDKSNEVLIRNRHRSHRFLIPQTIAEADFVVNIPVIKCRPYPLRISCALKNIYGCNAYPRKAKYHDSLDEVIVRLNKIIKTDLCIVDGIIADVGTPLRLGLVMASRDPVAIDAVASAILGYDPEKVRHIALAFKERIGNIHLNLAGEDLNHFKICYAKRPRTNRFGNFPFSNIIRSIYHSYFGKTKDV